MIAKHAKTKILVTMKSSNSVIDPVCRDLIRAAKEGDAQLLQSLLRHTLSDKVRGGAQSDDEYYLLYHTRVLLQ